jgi:arsenate reductase
MSSALRPSVNLLKKRKRAIIKEPIDKLRRIFIMKKVAFVCIHNSCRSQMAEGWAKHLGSGVLEVYSAGTEEYHEVKPAAIQVMNEAGIDMSEQYPKLLVDIPEEIDILITMGCGVACPFVSCKHQEDWGLVDPSGGSMEDFRNTRDIIENKVADLIKRVKSNVI